MPRSARVSDPLATFIANPRRLAVRTWLFYVHLVTSIVLGLYFVLIGITGSIIVFEPELSDLTMPPAADRAAAPSLPLGEIVDRVRDAYPGRKVTFVRWYPESEDRFRVRVAAATPADIDTYVYVDRATGAMLGESPWWIRWTMELHFYLLAGTTGRIVNGVGAIFLAVACLSGLFVWWPGIRQWARGFTVNLRSNWRGINYDVHRVVGIYALVALMLLAVTGIYYGFPDPFRRAANYRATPVSIEAPRQALDYDALVVRAARILPGGVVTALYPANGGTDTIRLRVKLPGDDWPFGRSEVAFDQYSGEVRGVLDVRELTLAQKVLVHWMSPIHYGRFGGVTTRVLWFVAGLTPLVLFVSGCLMWWNRSLSKAWRRRAGRPGAGAPVRVPRPGTAAALSPAGAESRPAP